MFLDMYVMPNAFLEKIFSSTQYYVNIYIKFYAVIIIEANEAMFGPYGKRE